MDKLKTAAASAKDKLKGTNTHDTTSPSSTAATQPNQQNVAPTATTPQQPTQEHFEAAATTLDTMTTIAAKPDGHTKEKLHAAANHEKSHSWFQSIFPQSSLESMENSWHLGNYVMDRETGQKTFEPMSIYVRLGMHLLYYGTEQEKPSTGNVPKIC